MRQNVYTIFDSKAEIFKSPFMAMNDAVALRMIEQAASDPNTDLGRYPADFTLFFIGTYQDHTGQYEMAEAKRHVADVITVVGGLSNIDVQED
jgi:hypothetical protein